ncbi:MAG: hypothetical protein GTO45_28620 [Candidatus Aminicenantes bacterium]|nr:hypothetical protein [Candidatus Aminicenantes bacterium]NIN22138.1 hypothetical protein [Candidatus Aminicenantes bacterium]NIN88734.1 hypothetical protein [Candidatus Aminicenantes bacterium]NIR09680.1 hypothetical protein [Candidatus Aminicenantes bacterium]
MKQVNVYFNFVRNQFIGVKEFSLEGKEICLDEYKKPDNDFSYEGEIKGLLVVGDFEVLVNCRGQNGFTWSVEIKIDGKPLTKEPITGKIGRRGISIHYESYPLPGEES